MVKSKNCRECGARKSISGFYRHTKMADGHLNKCKECVKTRVRDHRRVNESVREYDRRRSSLEHRKADARMRCVKWRRDNPEKYAAQTALGNAIRAGRIVREACGVCGNPRSHAHHEDYSKQLVVIWLCALHHLQLHSGRR